MIMKKFFGINITPLELVLRCLGVTICLLTALVIAWYAYTTFSIKSPDVDYIDTPPSLEQQGIEGIDHDPASDPDEYPVAHRAPGTTTVTQVTRTPLYLDPSQYPPE